MQLQCLYLKKNLITHVNEKHLRNLGNLLILDLAANKIHNIHSNAFRSLGKVFELHLSQNFLKEIPESLFVSMGRLKKLLLFSNDFRYLRSQYFAGLRWKEIFNCFSQHKLITKFLKLKFRVSSLTNLLLNNNNLKDFDADVFAPLINLTKLWVLIKVLA